MIKPEGTFVLSGNITEPGPVNIGMATVAVLGGPLNQVTANSFGFYELFGVSGTLTLRVSKPGYRDETRTLTVTQDQTLDVQIRPISAPTNVAGIYSVTLTISPSCSIVPDDQKTRTYTATIGQDMARLDVQLGDANFVADLVGRRTVSTERYLAAPLRSTGATAASITTTTTSITFKRFCRAVRFSASGASWLPRPRKPSPAISLAGSVFAPAMEAEPAHARPADNRVVFTRR